MMGSNDEEFVLRCFKNLLGTINKSELNEILDMATQESLDNILLKANNSMSSINHGNSNNKNNYGGRELNTEGKVLGQNYREIFSNKNLKTNQSNISFTHEDVSSIHNYDSHSVLGSAGKQVRRTLPSNSTQKQQAINNNFSTQAHFKVPFEPDNNVFRNIPAAASSKMVDIIRNAIRHELQQQEPIGDSHTTPLNSTPLSRSTVEEEVPYYTEQIGDRTIPKRQISFHQIPPDTPFLEPDHAAAHRSIHDRRHNHHHHDERYLNCGCDDPPLSYYSHNNNRLPISERGVQGHREQPPSAHLTTYGNREDEGEYYENFCNKCYRYSEEKGGRKTPKPHDRRLHPFPSVHREQISTNKLTAVKPTADATTTAADTENSGTALFELFGKISAYVHQSQSTCFDSSADHQNERINSFTFDAGCCQITTLVIHEPSCPKIKLKTCNTLTHLCKVEPLEEVEGSERQQLVSQAQGAVEILLNSSYSSNHNDDGAPEATAGLGVLETEKVLENSTDIENSSNEVLLNNSSSLLKNVSSPLLNNDKQICVAQQNTRNVEKANHDTQSTKELNNFEIPVIPGRRRGRRKRLFGLSQTEASKSEEVVQITESCITNSVPNNSNNCKSFQEDTSFPAKKKRGSSKDRLNTINLQEENLQSALKALQCDSLKRGDNDTENVNISEAKEITAVSKPISVIKSSGRPSTSPYASNSILFHHSKRKAGSTSTPLSCLLTLNNKSKTKNFQTSTTYNGSKKTEKLEETPDCEEVTAKNSIENILESEHAHFANAEGASIKYPEKNSPSSLATKISNLVDYLPSLDTMVPSTSPPSCASFSVLSKGALLLGKRDEEEIILLKECYLDAVGSVVGGGNNNELPAATLNPATIAQKKRQIAINRGTRFFGRRRKKKFAARRYIKWTREKMIEADAWIEAICRQKIKGTLLPNAKLDSNNDLPDSEMDNNNNGGPTADIAGEELSLLNVKKLSQILNVSLSSIYKYLRLTRPDYEGGPRKSLLNQSCDQKSDRRSTTGLGKGNRKRGRPPGQNGKDVEIIEEIQKIVSEFNSSKQLEQEGDQENDRFNAPPNSSFIEDRKNNVLVAYMSVTDILRRLPVRLRCSRVSLKKYLSQLNWSENRSRKNALTACNVTPPPPPCGNTTLQRFSSAAATNNTKNIFDTMEPKEFEEDALNCNNIVVKERRPTTQLQQQSTLFSSFLSSKDPPSLLNVPNFYSNLNHNSSSLSTTQITNTTTSIKKEPVTITSLDNFSENGRRQSSKSNFNLQHSDPTITLTTNPYRSNKTLSNRSSAGSKMMNIENLIAHKQSNGLLANAKITDNENSANNPLTSLPPMVIPITSVREFKKENAQKAAEEARARDINAKLRISLLKTKLTPTDIIFGGTLRLKIFELYEKFGVKLTFNNVQDSATRDSGWAVARSNAFVTVLLSPTGLVSFSVTEKDLDPRANIRDTVINTRDNLISCIDSAFQRYSNNSTMSEISKKLTSNHVTMVNGGETEHKSGKFISAILLLDEGVYDSTGIRVCNCTTHSSSGSISAEDFYNSHVSYIRPCECLLSVKDIVVTESKADILPDPYPLTEFFRMLRTELLSTTRPQQFINLNGGPRSSGGIIKCIVADIQEFLNKCLDTNYTNIYAKFQGF